MDDTHDGLGSVGAVYRRRLKRANPESEEFLGLEKSSRAPLAVSQAATSSPAATTRPLPRTLDA